MLPPELEGGGNSCRNNRRYACNYGNIKQGRCPGYLVETRNMRRLGIAGRGKYRMRWVDNTQGHAGARIRGADYVAQSRFNTGNPDQLERWNRTERCLPHNSSGRIQQRNIALRTPQSANAEANEFCDLYYPSGQREQKGCVNPGAGRGKNYTKWKYPMNQLAAPPRRRRGIAVAPGAPGAHVAPPIAPVVRAPLIEAPDMPEPWEPAAVADHPFLGNLEEALRQNDENMRALFSKSLDNSSELQDFAERSAEDADKLEEAAAQGWPPHEMAQVVDQGWPTEIWNGIHIYTNDAFQVKKSQTSGYGLFAKKDWIRQKSEKKTMHLPYTGKVVPEQDGKYIVSTRNGLHIDGNPKLASNTQSAPITISKASFANEPPRGERANAEFVDIQISPGVWIPALFPLRTIHRGEEIFVCYGAKYPRDYATSCNESGDSWDLETAVERYPEIVDGLNHIGPPDTVDIDENPEEFVFTSRVTGLKVTVPFRIANDNNANRRSK